MLGSLFTFLCKFCLELLPGDGFATGEFRGDVGSLEGFEGFADVLVVHCVDVFEEWDEADEIFVADLSFPGLQDDGVFGLVLDVGCFGVDYYDL